MRSLRPRVASVIVTFSLVAGCGSSASPAPTQTAAAVPTSAVAPPASPTATASASVPATTKPADPAPPASAAIPIRGSARTISAASVELAAGPDGGLYVAIPVRTGPVVLVLLDQGGRPRPGWPIAIKHSTACGRPLPVDDGTVRIVCDAIDIVQPEGDTVVMRAFAFDIVGRSMKGWPVELPSRPAQAVVGADLTVLTERQLTDTPADGETAANVAVTTVAVDGSIRNGTPVGLLGGCCEEGWAIGPEGVAYGVGWIDAADPPNMTALGRSGVPNGWPVKIAGNGSRPAFGSGGRIVVTVGSTKPGASEVLVLRGDGTTVASRTLPMATVEHTSDTGGCSVGSPRAAILAPDGTIFVYSELDPRIYALAPSLAIVKGWPFEPATSLATARPGLITEQEAGYCPTPILPSAGPAGALVLSLEARNAKVGGSLVAVDADGRIRAGWPVELKRPGAEFWSVISGPDGITFALAVEPETSGTSSASVLAIAPDSTVRYSTTIVDP